MNGSEESVGIFPSSSIILVNICKNESLRSTPEALQKAEDLRSLGIAVGACLSEKFGKSTALDKSAVLSSDGKEAGSANFFPEIETSLVPGELLALATIFRERIRMESTHQYWVT